MIPEHYFKVICCPKCKADLEANKQNEELFCRNCKTTYPVVEDIPILLHEIEDEASQIIKQFYDAEWEKDRDGILKAKVKHEDLSNLGQRYIQNNEKRFKSVFVPKRKQSFFLDAASGAQPRVEFGSKYTYHVCVDFSLEGLLESRKQLGERAICVCGSLLSVPLKDFICDDIIASHVLYHIDKDLQEKAIQHLSRVLRPNGKLLIFYGNPKSFEKVIVKGVKILLGRNKAAKGSDNKSFYFHPHTINYMLRILHNEFGNSKVSVKPLRMFTKAVTHIGFKHNIPGTMVFYILFLVERLVRRIPKLSNYIAYIAEK